MHRHARAFHYSDLIAWGRNARQVRPHREWTGRLRRSLLILALVASGFAGFGIVGFGGSLASAATPTTVTLDYTGSPQTWVAPGDVIGAISFTAVGGGGGGGFGGSGALVTMSVSAPAATQFNIYVGEAGTTADSTAGAMGGINGYSIGSGGDGGYSAESGYNGGSGGGALSGVESSAACGEGASDFCIIAGGGGGGGEGGASGGNGGYEDGTRGSGDLYSIDGDYGGIGGTPSGGISSGGVGSNGSFFVDDEGNPGGAGGGGGYAGGTGDGAFGGGGGGGGGSYVDTINGGLTGTSTPGNTEANGYVSITYTLGVPPTITSTQSSTSFVVGSSVPYTFTATGTPTPAFTENGALPSGVSFVDNGNGTATLSGTPTQSGSYPLSVTASNGESPNATESFTLDVDAAPQITSTQTAATALDGQAMTQVAFSATGYPVPNFTEVGSLPGGVTLSASGVLSGTPTQSGAFPLTVTANNGIGADASTSFTLIVEGSPQITSAAEEMFSAGHASTFTVTTTGYPTATLSLSGSSILPLGVSFTDNANGTASITGTPTAGGSYQLAITASSSAGAGAQTLDLVVDAVATFSSPTTIDIDAGSPVSFAVVTDGGYPTPTLSATAGSLPPGLSFTDDTNGIATLSGTVGAANEGTFTPTFTATEPGGTGASEAAILVVQAPGATVSDCPPGDLCGSGGEAEAAPQITSANSTTCYTGSTCSFAVVATGSPPPNFAATGGLPTGVTLSTAGVLSGTPTTSGAYPITLTAANGVTPDATQTFTLTISAPPSGGGGGGGGGTSPAPAPSITPTTTTTATPPPSPTPTTTTPGSGTSTGGGSTSQTTPPPVLTSYAVRAVLSGALRQTVTCSAAPTALHESAVKGKLKALGLSLNCKAGKVKATLLVSIASKIEVKRQKTKTRKIIKTDKTVWIGGVQLAEPTRRLTLTLKPKSASVNNKSILTSTASGDILQGHTRKTLTLRLNVTPKYSG